MWGHRTLQYAVAIGSVLVATLAAIPFYPEAADLPTLLLLAAVSVAASFGGHGPAAVSVFLSFLSLDFFFEYPPYSFEVSALGTSLDLIAFIMVAALLGTLNARLHLARQRALAARRGAEEALKARDEALAIVSHDLRTPLTAIKTSVSTLRNPGMPLSEITRLDLLGTIESEADRLTHFVGDALAMSRLEAGIAPDPQWNALGEIVSAVVDRLAPVLGDRPLRYDVPDTLPLARFDAGLLDQVLSNILENVAVHTPAGTQVAIVGRVDAAAVRIEVDDAGPGIAIDDRERIFAKFARLHEGNVGTGLGLAIARAATQAQGGTIYIEDSCFGGARFVMVIPNAVLADQNHAR